MTAPRTRIEFCHETVNPLVGCSRKSPGCANCYALRMARRHEGNPKTPQYHGITRTTERGLDWTGEVRWVPGVLEKALVRLVTSKTRRRIFVCSMSDIAHEKATLQHLANVYAFAAALPQHPVILITKRPDLLLLRTRALVEKIGDFRDIWDAARKPLHDACRVASSEFFKRNRNSKSGQLLLKWAEFIGYDRAFPRWPLPNVMLMATVEDQERLEERAEDMLELAEHGWHVGFIHEPLLGPLDWSVIRHGSDHDLPILGTQWGPEWIVVGHEQGPGRRLQSTSISGNLIAQACGAGVPVFFKKDSHGLRGDPDRQPRQFPAWMLVDGEAA